MPKKKWQKPVLHDHSTTDHEHRVTWLELFYDLVFVVTISQLTHHLANDITLKGIGTFIFLFIPVWWAWIGMTFYSDRFETHDISQRLFTFLSMLGVASLAYHIPHALDSSTTGFVLSYSFIRIILAVLWARAGVYNKPFRPYAKRYSLGLVISICLWIFSLQFSGPIQWSFWAVGLAIEYLTPLTTKKIKKRLPSQNNSGHLPERFGLFMIIVLGESIIGIVQGLSSISLIENTTLLNSILGISFIFTVWWMYFDHINERKMKAGPWYLTGWSYGHLPLVMSIGALGAGILNLVKAGNTTLDLPTLWLVCGTVSVSLISMGLIELTLQKKEHTPCSEKIGKLTRFGGAILCLVLPLIDVMRNTPILLSALIIIFLIQIIQGEQSHDHMHEEYAFID
jgi:low temperature requirement protein LtrA